MVDINTLLSEGFKEFSHPLKMDCRSFQKKIEDDKATKYFINAYWYDFSDVWEEADKIPWQWGVEFEITTELESKHHVALRTQGNYRENIGTLELSEVYELFEEFWQRFGTYED